jgi:hypothetical protein
VTTLVNLEILLTGHFFDQWPFAQIYLNNKLIFDKQIEHTQILKFEISCNKKNKLKFVHYNKSYGDNGLWHSDGTNECWFSIDDIKFDNVSIGDFKSKLIFKTSWTPHQLTMHSDDFINKHSIFNSNGVLTFNGSIEFKFETPIYNWLIITKYKQPITDTAYFSGSGKRWHYDDDLKIIEEIKKIMNF